MSSSRQLENAFINCVSMQSIDLTTDIVTTSSEISYADYAFAGCKALTTVNLGDYFEGVYNTETGTIYASGLSFVSMFEGCSSLTTVTGTICVGFTGGYQPLKDMFKGCTNLRSANLDCGVIDTEDYVDLMAQNVDIDGVTYDYAYEYLGLSSDYINNGINITYSRSVNIGG